MSNQSETIVLSPSPHVSTLAPLGDLLGISLTSSADLCRLVSHGIPAKAYLSIMKRLSMTHGDLDAPTSIRNRLNSPGRLTPDQSERLVLICRTYIVAVGVFGSEEKAVSWLHTSANLIPGLPELTPLRLSARDSGVRFLEEKLLQIAYGIF